MNPVNNVGNVGGGSPVQKVKVVNQPVQRQIAADAPRQLPAVTDRLELSGVSHLLKALKANADVRTDKVAALRQQIEAGTYEDEAKLDIAIDRMLDDLSR